MSFDPYLPPEETPYDPGSAPQAGPEARARVQLPALVLLALGGLNLLAAILPVAHTVHIFFSSAEQIHQDARRGIDVMPPVLVDEKGKEVLRKQLDDQSPEMLKQQQLVQFGIFSVLALLLPSLILYGGLQMLRLRSYNMAVLAAILVAIPCVSPVACIGVGEVAGLWALWVLLNPDVRASFP